jgi:tetratricopeptide (TPR) repeat protein
VTPEIEDDPTTADRVKQRRDFPVGHGVSIMRLPWTKRRLMVMVAILASAIAGPIDLARSGDDEQNRPVVVPGVQEIPPTIVSILQQAIVAADDAPARDSLPWTAIAATLARAGHADDALRLASGDREKNLKESIIRATAITQARSGDIAGALRSARLLPAPESRQVVALIAAQRAWAGGVTEARRMAEAELAGEPESEFALRLIAHVLEQKGDFAEAARTYEAIPSLKEKARGCRPAARARLKEGDLPGALRAAEESRRLAIDYLAQRPPHRGRASSMPDEIGPDMFRDQILGEIALEQARKGDALGARKTAEEITRHYSRALIVAEAAAILARAGDRPSAKALIKWAFGLAELAGYRGFELMEIATAETLAGETGAARKTFLRALETVGPAVMNQSIVPAAQARAGDLEGAIQTVGAIADRAARQRALRSIARTLAKAGDAPKAVEIAGGIASAKEKILALQEVGEAQADAGDRVGALATIRLAAKIEGAPERESLRAMARSLSQLGDAREALAWVNDRGTPPIRSWGLLGVAEGLLPRVVDPSLQLENP